MQQDKTNLQKRIESGKSLVTAEIAPPRSANGDALRAVAKRFGGKVHALGVSDNKDGVTMSAVAAASILAASNVEPILHMATRDRKRVALISDFLGAGALGVRNVLCTSGTHQTLLPFRTSKNVFDIDATVFLQTLRNLQINASLVGEENIEGQALYCLGAVASPFADPVELQLPRLAQKIFVGAQFIVTPPVFDLERFKKWWHEVTNRGLHEKAAFIAGIKIFTDASAAKAFAQKRPLPMVPDALLARLASKSGSCRAEGIKIALETIGELSALNGLRGFEIIVDDDIDASLEVLETLKPRLG
jgi:methylenetetrahydrofolate reductase (NADPH)